MKQLQFLSILSSNKLMKSRLTLACEAGGDGTFYFELGRIFGELKIKGWDSDAFVDKVCNICGIEF
jgi:hypothetical protein